jgi:AraC-like DNA-binding protein
VRWFAPLAPAPDLHEVVECRYTAAAVGHHDLLPDGRMDLVWTEPLGAVLCGPDTRAWSFEMPAGREIAGVRFRPGAAAGVFGVSAAELVDRRVPLADVLGSRVARQLEERLAGATDEGRPGLLDDLVRRHAPAAPDPASAWARQVAGDPRTGVDAVAAAAGLSARQLRRRFDRAVGYGPAFLARVARLQRFAQHALTHPDRGLAELAAAAGYVDQAHLAKDTRAIAGRSPRQVRASLDRSSIVVDVGAGGRSVHDALRPPARPSAA